MNHEQDLIYDVGMHNGDDTAYYLHKGFRVIAIDANPAMVTRLPMTELQSQLDRAAAEVLWRDLGMTEAPDFLAP